MLQKGNKFKKTFSSSFRPYNSESIDFREKLQRKKYRKLIHYKIGQVNNLKIYYSCCKMVIIKKKAKKHFFNDFLR